MSRGSSWPSAPTRKPLSIGCCSSTRSADGLAAPGAGGGGDQRARPSCATRCRRPASPPPRRGATSSCRRPAAPPPPAAARWPAGCAWTRCAWPARGPKLKRSTSLCGLRSLNSAMRRDLGRRRARHADVDRHGVAVVHQRGHLDAHLALAQRRAAGEAADRRGHRLGRGLGRAQLHCERPGRSCGDVSRWRRFMAGTSLHKHRRHARVHPRSQSRSVRR